MSEPWQTRPIRTCASAGLACMAVLLFLASPLVFSDELTIEVKGIKEPLLGQVENSIGAYSITSTRKLSARRLKQTTEEVLREAEEALRPFGYYHPNVTAKLEQNGEQDWIMTLQVSPGPAVIISSVSVELAGDGAQLEDLRRWKKHWPLSAGQVLNQSLWDSQKQAALDIAESHGYLGAHFTVHSIEADLNTNEAVLNLVLDTGPQAVMGSVTFKQDVIRPGVLELLPRFKPGQPYDSWLMEKFRLDLWRTGYFKDVEIIEERRLEDSPPLVNLVVTASERTRNTYQGSLGYGTDTSVRAQVLWTRHVLSSRGDSLDMGLGWQQQNSEYSFRSNYRLPRASKARQFWIANLGVRKENQDFEVKANDDDPDFIKLTNGNVTDYSVKLGNLVVRDLRRGYQQIFETWYGQYVFEKSTFNLRDLTLPGQDVTLDESELNQFKDTDSSLSLGVNWDWPVVQGSGFQTEGQRVRAWIFTANKVWGSDLEFSQAYLSANWVKLLASRWKLILRGEVGYSDANTSDLSVDFENQLVQLSVTDLPNLYRFKAGGSRSVRGYSFESLSNNGIGSNSIITGSTEIELSFRQNWAVAAFVDVGNAFNDWNDTDLKLGAGLGIRWYSIAGPVSLDFAQARSYDGNPWQIHFTIGTPLL